METISTGQALEKLIDKTSDSLYAQIVGIIRHILSDIANKALAVSCGSARAE